MSGITSSTGLISGINSSAIIDQLIQIDSRPKRLAQSRLAQLQQQQAAFLDINSKLAALKTAATKLREAKIFNSATATSSNPDVLGVSTQPGALPGSYSFLVDRTVSSQQLLTRGFLDRNASATGLTSIVVEPAAARLDSVTELAQLNGGNGVSRGKIVVTDRAGTATTVDLSRAATVNDVLSAFNDHATVKVRASVQGGQFVLTDTSAGSGDLSVRSSAGYTTAESLGIAQTVSGTTTITGSLVYTLGDNTTVQSLNDGSGIRFNTAAGTTTADFTVKTRDGSSYDVDIGDIYGLDGVKTSSAVSTIGQLKARLLAQTENKVSVQVAADGRSISLVDASAGGTAFQVIDLKGAAADLGIVGTAAADTINGRAVFAGLNSTLVNGLQGGLGIANGAMEFKLHDGTVVSADFTGATSVSDIINTVASATSGKVSLALDSNGTSFTLTDNTSGADSFQIDGAGATALGFAVPGGGAAQTVSSSHNNHRFVSESTLLSQLNGGLGVGTGSFEIYGPTAGQKSTISISSSIRSVGDLIANINSRGIGVLARINDAGNGIILEKDPLVTTDTQKIRVVDTTGTTARSLNLAGEAPALGATNAIDGSYRRTITLAATDTLDQIVTKLNSARAGVTASVITDGASATPFRLRISANQPGSAGRFQLEGVGADLGVTTVTQGENSRVFFGADDPAKAILVSRASNTIAGVIDNVSLTVKGRSDTAVTVNVSRDDNAIVKAIQEFATAFNSVSGKIFDVTRYDPNTERKGVLLGDSTALSIRSEMYAAINGTAQGVSGQFQNLAQVGVSIGKNGDITVNETKLREALANDPQAVTDVFSAFVQDDRPTVVEVLPGVTGVTATNSSPFTFSSLGVLERIARLADRYLDSTSGLLTNKTKSLEDEVTAQNKRISNYDSRLAAKRAYYEQKFAALESTLASLQTQQSALGSLNV